MLWTPRASNGRNHAAVCNGGRIHICRSRDDKAVAETGGEGMARAGTEGQARASRRRLSVSAVCSSGKRRLERR